MRFVILPVIAVLSALVSAPRPAQARAGDSCIYAGYVSTRNSRGYCSLPGQATRGCSGGGILCNPLVYGFGADGGGICTNNRVYATTDCERKYNAIPGYGSAKVAEQIRAKGLGKELEEQKKKLSGSCSRMTNQTGLCRTVTEKTKAVAESDRKETPKAEAAKPLPKPEVPSPAAPNAETKINSVKTTGEGPSSSPWLTQEPLPAQTLTPGKTGRIEDSPSSAAPTTAGADNAERPDAGDDADDAQSSNTTAKSDRKNFSKSDENTPIGEEDIQDHQTSTIAKTSETTSNPVTDEERAAGTAKLKEAMAAKSATPAAAPPQKTPEQIKAEAAEQKAAADRKKEEDAKKAEAAKKKATSDDKNGVCFEDKNSYDDAIQRNLIKNTKIRIPMYMVEDSSFIDAGSMSAVFQSGKIKFSAVILRSTELIQKTGYVSKICIKGDDAFLVGKETKKITIQENGEIKAYQDASTWGGFKISSKQEHDTQAQTARGGGASQQGAAPRRMR